MISLEKWMILTPLQKLPNNVRELGKIIVVTSFEWLSKVQKNRQIWSHCWGSTTVSTVDYSIWYGTIGAWFSLFKLLILKMVHAQPLFNLFLFFQTEFQFLMCKILLLHNTLCKIWTHDLSAMSFPHNHWSMTPTPYIVKYFTDLFQHQSLSHKLVACNLYLNG